MDAPLGMTGHVLKAIANDGLKLIVSFGGVVEHIAANVASK